MAGERFGERATINQFRDAVWVRCPRCAGRAVVAGDTGWSLDRSDRRLTCAACGLARTWDRRRLLVNATRFSGAAGTRRPAAVGYVERSPSSGRWLDPETGREVGIPSAFATMEPWFGCSVWLQAPCCGHTLWAHNARHLDFLARYVGATLRESTTSSTQVMPANLPTWMKAARNRTAILHQISRLRDTW